MARVYTIYIKNEGRLVYIWKNGIIDEVSLG